MTREQRETLSRAFEMLRAGAEHGQVMARFNVTDMNKDGEALRRHVRELGDLVEQIRVALDLHLGAQPILHRAMVDKLEQSVPPTELARIRGKLPRPKLLSDSTKRTK